MLCAAMTEPHETSPQAILRIRPFLRGDEAALFRVFHSAVHVVAARDYTPEQLAAWAPDDLDRAEWAQRMQVLRPCVALLDEAVVGYADLQPNGYITHFFVSGLHPRRGIGAALMEQLHVLATQLGLAELRADVSLTAEPFFAAHGFTVVQRQQPVRRGVALANARMRKDLLPLAHRAVD